MDRRLEVNRGHLIQGLANVGGRSSKLHKRGRAILGFDGSFLTVEAGDVTFIARATGVWPGNAVVSVTLIQGLAYNTPAGDPMIVTCDGSYVRFGPIQAGCVWQPISAAVLDTPLQAEWLEGLALRYQLPRGRLIAEGRRGEIQVAERKLRALLRRVGKILAPLGVTVADLEALVEKRMSERHLSGNA